MNNSSVADSGRLDWIRAWLPVLVAVCAICVETTADFGADHTSGPLLWLWEHLLGPVSSPEWGHIHHYIRKTGHFLGYGAIALTWLHAWHLTFARWTFLRCASIAFACTALMAAADELHQSFLPNRTGMFRDVLLDCCGALVLQAAAWLLLRLLRPASARAF